MASPAPLPPQSELDAFVARAWREGERWERPDMPWRGVDDPYAVCVSEVMLQQTQVPRVLGRWERFMDEFPTLVALDAAETSQVLAAWQGLGYNRRALALKRMAAECVERWGGGMPETAEALQTLPGVGPATAAGVVAFAYRKPAVYIETNVRTVVIERFFADREGPVPDKEIRPIVEATCSRDHPREWYYALLDWGAHLKAEGSVAGRWARAYTRQSRFDGSRRQKRAFLVRAVLDAPGMSTEGLVRLLNDQERAADRAPVAPDDVAALLSELSAEGFFARTPEGGWKV